MPLDIVRNDLTKMHVDAIVNSADPLPVVGGGVDGCIHKSAGIELLQERMKIGTIAVGDARITKGYQLPCKYVIHTVGPVADQQDMEVLLERCYRKSLELAKQYICESIAFPLISTGAYGVNKKVALRVAIRTIQSFLEDNDMLVYLVVFDKESYQVSSKLYASVQSYIDENYVDTCLPRLAVSRNRSVYVQTVESCHFESALSLSDLMENMDATFSETLFYIIDKKGLKDPEVYNRANMDRRLFSKIRSHKNYQPSKATALALAFALKLNLDETKDLLLKAGYALTHSNKMDIIIEYFIENENYDIYELNEVLFAFDQPTLGG